MNAQERAIIRKNFTFLIQNIDVNSIRHYLCEKYVLTTDDMEVLSMPGHTRTYNNEVLLLHILPRRGQQAYTEFVNSLQQEGHFAHVAETLQNTVLSKEDLEKAQTETHGMQSDRYEAIHREVDEMYERIQRRKTARMADKTKAPIGSACRTTQRIASNQSVGFDEPDGGQVSLPEDTFAIHLETSEASERCRFDNGAYMLHLSINGIALISRGDFLKSGDIKSCPQKVSWGYHVIRQYGSGPDRFVLEVGRRASTGQGMFYFKTTSSDDGSLISLTIKKYTNNIRQNNVHH